MKKNQIIKQQQIKAVIMTLLLRLDKESRQPDIHNKP